MADKLQWNTECLSILCSSCGEDVEDMTIKAEIEVSLEWGHQGDEAAVEYVCKEWTYCNVRLECSCGAVIREDESDLFVFDDGEYGEWVVRVKKRDDNNDTN